MSDMVTASCQTLGCPSGWLGRDCMFCLCFSGTARGRQAFCPCLWTLKSKCNLTLAQFGEKFLQPCHAIFFSRIVTFVLAKKNNNNQPILQQQKKTLLNHLWFNHCHITTTKYPK